MSNFDNVKFSNNDFKSLIFGRHSIRHYDPSVKIPRSELKEMLAEATTAPSSCNLQSWHFIVVDTDEGKEKLKKFFMKFNYPQLESCSAMVLFFGYTDAFKKYRDLWQGMYDRKEITHEMLEKIFATFLPLYEHASQDVLISDGTRDCGLVAMQFMLLARAYGYETNPIGGYDWTKAAAVMGLDPQKYFPVMAVSIGKPEKGAQEVETNRYPIDEVMQFM
ncbi:MAG: nitroreductase family protein [Lactobacillus sp.]|jgi:nitroreductase|nr:nitroreductase family protein [Lactobacillus sp.]MCH4068498.1 nitroreductase family protein [Lactobacillus sp.]MCI1304247.1 nitroreductase family protein [Lactobacillus sp.]MCI1330452.1 nitroreductase family protein [Lactobacillus sp.]MCI1359246.1 nitroreductase family protein [Lactobacillus sp.]